MTAEIVKLFDGQHSRRGIYRLLGDALQPENELLTPVSYTINRYIAPFQDKREPALTQSVPNESNQSTAIFRQNNTSEALGLSQDASSASANSSPLNFETPLFSRREMLQSSVASALVIGLGIRPELKAQTKQEQQFNPDHIVAPPTVIPFDVQAPTSPTDSEANTTFWKAVESDPNAPLLYLYMEYYEELKGRLEAQKIAKATDLVVIRRIVSLRDNTSLLIVALRNTKTWELYTLPNGGDGKPTEKVDGFPAKQFGKTTVIMDFAKLEYKDANGNVVEKPFIAGIDGQTGKLLYCLLQKPGSKEASLFPIDTIKNPQENKIDRARIVIMRGSEVTREELERIDDLTPQPVRQQEGILTPDQNTFGYSKPYFSNEPLTWRTGMTPPPSPSDKKAYEAYIQNGFVQEVDRVAFEGFTITMEMAPGAGVGYATNRYRGVRFAPDFEEQLWGTQTNPGWLRGKIDALRGMTFRIQLLSDLHPSISNTNYVQPVGNGGVKIPVGVALGTHDLGSNRFARLYWGGSSSNKGIDMDLDANKYSFSTALAQTLILLADKPSLHDNILTSRLNSPDVYEEYRIIIRKNYEMKGFKDVTKLVELEK